MSRADNKVAQLSRRLDCYQNFLERLRTHRLMPIELKTEIAEVMLKVREMEKNEDKSVNARTRLH